MDDSVATDSIASVLVVDFSSLSLSGPSSAIHEHTNHHEHRQLHDGLDGDFNAVLDDVKNRDDLHACSRCGIHDSVVRCLVCSKWFCHSPENMSASHIVNHLLRAKYKEIILRSEGSSDETPPECGSKNVFMLGFVFIPNENDTRVVLLCPQPCASNFEDRCFNSSLSVSLIKGRSFLTWLASPNETEQLGSREVSFVQMDHLEDYQPNERTPISTTEPLPQPQPLQADDSPDVVALVREAYLDGQKALQTELDKAIAELRDVKAENKHLTDENQSQQSSISQLKIELDEVKQAHDHSSVQIKDIQTENKDLIDENQSQKHLISQLQIAQDRSAVEITDLRADNQRLTDEHQLQQRSVSHLKTALRLAQNSSVEIKDQLRHATTSLNDFLKQKNGWQVKLDLMQHKLHAAERRVRCLDHLTRFKLESREDTAYVQPNQRGEFPASTDVIELMHSLNEEIYETCVQLADEGLARRSKHSNKHMFRAQKVLGDRLTAMMEKQATKTDYDVLLMQSVLQVFMVHWCSSIIEAFYPKQVSFADIFFELSAQASISTGMCGKQPQIVQPTSSKRNPNKVKFKGWVEDIINELESFLKIAGIRMKTRFADLFFTKTLNLVKVAYDLRTAMAEKEICGGLEAVIVEPDTPFQENLMVDAHDEGDSDTDQLPVDFVAGTIGIGLQRRVSGKVNGHSQSRIKTELKPTVVLVRTLEG